MKNQEFNEPVFELFKKLSPVFAPTGCEVRVLETIKNELEKVCECSYDAVGNLICHQPGAKKSTAEGQLPQTVAYISGVDEAGFMITKIDDKGYVRVESTGNGDPACFIGKNMLVGNEKTLLEGVGGGKVLHLLSGDERSSAPGFDKLFIDVGAEKKEELEGRIEIGDFAAFTGECFDLPGECVAGKALECRANCAVLIQMLKNNMHIPAALRRDVYVIFAVKEKIGYSGAVTALHRIVPDSAVLLGFEPSCDLDEKDEEKKGAVLGKGPVLSLKDGRALYYDSDFFESVKNMPGQKQILDGALTLSSSRGHLARKGIPMISLRLPCHNPETPYVIVNKNDVRNMLSLISALAVNSDDESNHSERN